MPDDTDFGPEDDAGVTAALHRAVATLPAPTDRMVAGGMARGRRRRRLVRTGEAVSALAVAAGVAGVVVATIPDHASAPLTDPGTRSAPLSTPTSKAEQQHHAMRAAVTPQSLLQAALDSLPGTGSTRDYEGTSGTDFVGTGFTYDDGAGAVRISVGLTLPDDGSDPKAPVVSPPCEGLAPSACHDLPDGAQAQASQGHEYPAGHPDNPLERDVRLVRSDGTQVEIIEWNSIGKASAPTRALPPFTLDELVRWADDPAFSPTTTRAAVRADRHLFRASD